MSKFIGKKGKSHSSGEVKISSEERKARSDPT